MIAEVSRGEVTIGYLQNMPATRGLYPWRKSTVTCGLPL